MFSNTAKGQRTKYIVAERTVCYCSNFDLSFSEWVTMAENLTEFGDKLYVELGDMWHNWFKDAADLPQIKD